MRKNLSSFLTQTIFTLLALYLTFLLLRYPAQSLKLASTGLLLWFQKMIPTLLPFMILSGIMVRMNLTERFARCFHPLFHFLFGTTLNGSYAILMGMLCGFPMGARVIGELLHAQKLSEKEASYLLAFCNNIGPIYFISFVMSTLSIHHNYIPFLIMYGMPLIYGVLLYRFYYKSMDFSAALPTGQQQPKVPISSSLLAAVDDSVISGLIGIGKLGGYMVFFNLLNIMFLPFSTLPESFLALCNCMLEITSGISRIGIKGFYMILILLPFGGFSCMAQTYSMIKETNLSINHYFLHKCVQTVLTAFIYAFFVFSGVCSF
ncbi:MAG: hypothetical protein PUD93_07740 [Lachnospiraceae bacterium]|nr:hypothetical protein [Lachnospiraceae bacterium]